MPRALAIATALFALATPPAHAQDLPAATPDTVLDAPPADAADTDVPDDGGADDVEDEVYDDEEVTFCGPTMSVVDRVRNVMEYFDPERAYEILVGALRHGEVEAWVRGQAVALLAELQLRRGEPGRAIVNFLRAERLEPGVTDRHRVAYATALFLTGARRRAGAVALEARDALCADRYAAAACYSANQLLARTQPNAEDRARAAAAAERLRAENPDLAPVFDAADARVQGP